MNKPEQCARLVLGNSDLVVVDVGAAAFLTANFQVLERISRLCLFEPNPEEAKSLERKYHAQGLGNVRVFPEGLAGSNGARTLYLTHVPTGSSLLQPDAAVIAQLADQSYFYPIREVTVQTRRLGDVLEDAGLGRADAIKVDVQGAELEVLQGVGEGLARDTLSVELEIGFPGAYKDQPGFGDIDGYLRAAGFVLYDLRVSHWHRIGPDIGKDAHILLRRAGNAASLPRRITEGDAIYFQNPSTVLASHDAARVRRLMTLMGAYGFFLDALDLLARARKDGLVDAAEFHVAREALLDWHAAGHDVIFDSPLLARLSGFLRRVSRFTQRRLFGKRFWRWID